MTQTRTRILVLTASVRDGRIGPTITGWFLRAVADTAADVDLHTLDLDDLDDLESGSAAGLVDAADGFVVVTPEYNHSYPGPVKSFIDSHVDEWAHKPVMFVSYGGASGGLRAVEHLRAVVGELRMVPIRDGVVIHRPWNRIVDGTFVSDQDTDSAARSGLTEVARWARTLAPLRTERVA